MRKDFADYPGRRLQHQKIPEEETVHTPVSPRLRSRELLTVSVIIYTAKPGVVIGKGGAEIEKVKKEAQKLPTRSFLLTSKK
jgi:small subunit ribosomal protein S3